MNDCTETVDRRPLSPRGRTTLILAAGVAVCAALTFAAGRASAATFSEGDDDGYVLPAGETVNDNLFAAGLKVTIDGTVDGDLFAAGQEVIINGTVTGNLFGAGSRVHLAKGGHVNGDMFAGGSEVSVAGQLDGDLRAGGTVVRVLDGGTVGGELMAGGFHVGVDEGGTVRRGLYAGGNQVALDGAVHGDVEVGAGAVRLKGKLDGDVNVVVSSDTGGAPPAALLAMMPNQPAIDMPPSIAAGVDVDPSAEIGGDLSLTGRSEPNVPTGVVGGKSSFEAQAAAPVEEAEPADTAAAIALRWLKRTLALIVLGLIALSVLPGVVRSATDGLRNTPLASGLWGVLSLAVTPVLIGVILVGAIVVSLILRYVLLGQLIMPWLAVAALLMAMLTAGLYVAVWCGYATVAITLGRLFGGRLRDERWMALLAGAPIVALAMVLPVVGTPARWLIMAFGLGAILLPWVRGWRSAASNQPGTMPMPAA